LRTLAAAEAGPLPAGNPFEVAERRSLLAELKRRNVWRAAVIYVAGVWALSQGIAQLAPYVGAPDWVVRWFLAACVIGFPFWIAFAWFYAWTPQGFKREEEVERDSTLTRRTDRKLDFWIIGVLTIAVALLVTNQFVLHRDVTSQANAAETQATLAALAKVPEQSVAVLPFANESGDSKQQYFSDGLSEELISDLTQLNGLKVIGKYSSFKFRDSKDSPAQIGATLGVANLIEGSVLESGERIRIVVNLIRARDGTSAWSHSYDQQLKDVFAIQSQIGRAVASALRVKLLGRSAVNDEKPPSGNVQAYQLMLQGRAIARRQTEAGFRQGIALLRRVVELDPDYAYAWGVLSNALINLGVTYLTGDAQQQTYAEARAAADRELALAPDTASTYIDRAYVLALLDGDQTGALAQIQRALALAPHEGTTVAYLAVQYNNLGQMQQAVDLFRKAIATDPLRVGWYYDLSYPLLTQGHLDESEQAVHKALTLQPDFPGAYLQLVIIDILRGEANAAMRDAEKETDPRSKAIAIALAKQAGDNAREADAALKDYVARQGKTQPYYVAELYALRKQPDDTFHWLQRARTETPAITVSGLLSDPLLLRYKDDPRFAALCRQLGLPAPGEPLPAH
jgi:TolB-like protein/tetratricopeptide (TPR) repeat protein